MYNNYAETKYWDRSARTVLELYSPWVGDQVNGGVSLRSTGTMSYSFTFNDVKNVATPGGLQSMIPVGTRADRRLANVISPEYVKGSITFTAAAIKNELIVNYSEITTVQKTQGQMLLPANPQGGEAYTIPTGCNCLWSYCRTSIRWMIVRDNQVNSTDTNIGWDTVMTNSDNIVNGCGSIHAEQMIENMSRFDILRDQLVDLNAMNPQKTVSFELNHHELENIRYNGINTIPQSNYGLFIIAAAYIQGWKSQLSADDQIAPELAAAPGMTWHSRLAYTDS